MDEFYNEWQMSAGMKRRELLEKKFTPLHIAAVLLGNLNYQVGNGGFAQWWDNGYGQDDIKDLIEYAKRGVAQVIKHYPELLKILEDVQNVGDPKEFAYTETEETDCSECGGYDEWYDAISAYDKPYYVLEGIEGSFQEFLDRFNESVDTNNIKAPINPDFKPKVKLVGENGNIFNLMGIASGALRKVGLKEKAHEMTEKITKTAHSYDEALAIITEYVDVR